MDSSVRPIGERIRAILEELSREERQLLAAVISAERDKLFMKLPRGINDDVWRVVSETIK